MKILLVILVFLAVNFSLEEEMSNYTRENTIVLFDVDGTLTKPRNRVTQDITDLLSELKKRVHVGVVGGSDTKKIQEQLGEHVETEVDYLFSENGLVGFQNGKQFHVQSLKAYLGEERLKQFLNFTLSYLATLDIPIKRGTFIEFRNGMLNISPIGRNCTQEEREEFLKYDLEKKIRAKMVEELKKKFPDFGLRYSIGGQISFDVFPEGWDKTYCLRFLEQFPNIFFYGDKTEEGENDYEIYSSKRVKGFSVKGPEDTKKWVTERFLQ